MSQAYEVGLPLTKNQEKSKTFSNLTDFSLPASASSELQSPSTKLLKEGKRVIWRDIYAEVPSQSESSLAFWRRKRNESRVVLDQVSGIAEPGELTFIMGASGAGKTTLLNILTQRNTKGIKVYGEVLVNKQPVQPADMRKISAYVQQEDEFIGELTVRETILLAARLRMSGKFTLEEKIKRVDNVIRAMGLINCKDTRIGCRYVKTISRGEKKRLAFACEILTDPPILFCDEPTSGLDSYMAEQVISVLKKFAIDGKTVISTIHQPSSQVYELADKLCLMANGHVAYQGNADEVAQFFTNSGFPMPQNFMNPSDHFMKVMSRAESEPEKEHLERVTKIISLFRDSTFGDVIHHITHYNSQSNSSRRRLHVDYSQIKTYKTSWITQTLLLTCRAFRCVIRNPMILQVRLFQVVMCAVLIGCIFLRTSMTHSTVMNFMGLMFNAVRDMNFMFVFPCIQVFTADMNVVAREHRAGMYYPSAYYVGKNLADTLQYLCFPLVYSGIIFFMAFTPHDVSMSGVYVMKFFRFLVVNTTMATTATSMGYAAACIFGSLEIASQILPLFIIPLFVFGGLFINLNTVPTYFTFFQHISYHRYAFEAHMNNIFNDVKEIPGCTNMTELYCHTTSESKTQGQDLMTFMSMRHDWFWIDIAILVAIALFLRIIGVIALQIRMTLR